MAGHTKGCRQQVGADSTPHKTEKGILPPATRYFVTFPVLNQWENLGASPAPGINALLNAGIAGGTGK